jgi:hypothetical protein
MARLRCLGRHGGFALGSAHQSEINPITVGTYAASSSTSELCVCWCRDGAAGHPQPLDPRIRRPPSHALLTALYPAYSLAKARVDIELIDDIARESHQPSLTPPILIALLRRIFDSDNSLQACSPDMHIDETLYYLQALEDQRAKRIKALESRGGAEATKCIKLSRNAIGRYGYITHGLKLWVHSPKSRG